MKTLKKVGTIAAGALMVGAAIAGSASAGMDDTGLTKGFFYDAGYNPIVQIVVGEKGMATDAVAAGNISRHRKPSIQPVNGPSNGRRIKRRSSTRSIRKRSNRKIRTSQQNGQHSPHNIRR
jgi:hypothetical protein